MRMPTELEYWTLDEVAECLPVTQAAYSELWGLVPPDDELPKRGEWPEPDSPDRRACSLKRAWPNMTDETKASVISALEDERKKLEDV